MRVSTPVTLFISPADITKSVEVVSLLRKPDAIQVEIDVRWVGFDIPNEFVVGYGLDYAEHYRSLKGVGILNPEVYRKK